MTTHGAIISVLDYQVQLYRIAKQVGVAYALVFMGTWMSAKLEKITAALDGGTDADLSALPEMHATSAGLKALCTFSAADGLEECRKCCGGHGVMLASGVAQFAMDYVTYCTAEGDRIILELQSARYLMKSLRAAKENGELAGACKYLEPLRNAGYNIQSQRCSAESVSQMRNLNVLLDAFKYRALSHVVAAGNRYEAIRSQGKKHDEAWNACAVDLVQASRVHCYFVILNSFSETCQTAEDAAMRAALTRLCQLFALQNMQESLGDWMGYLSPQQGAFVKEAVRDLLGEIRPDMVALTDAFEFPDNVLNSALGRHDGNAYESLYAAAKSSPLNKGGLDKPFAGYKFLEPMLDKEFIADHRRQMGTPAPPSRL